MNPLNEFVSVVDAREVRFDSAGPTEPSSAPVVRVKAFAEIVDDVSPVNLTGVHRA